MRTQHGTPTTSHTSEAPCLDTHTQPHFQFKQTLADAKETASLLSKEESEGIFTTERLRVRRG